MCTSRQIRASAGTASTNVRNVGSKNHSDAAIKPRIEGGHIPGPRIASATYAIGAAGGHCDTTEMPPSVMVPGLAVADGTEAICAAVRKHGAEGIKFCATGGVYPNGDNARQFVTMVTWGMRPLQAIRSATLTAAEALGRSSDLGAMAVGRHADLIAVAGNPLDGIAVLQNAAFVMKGGVAFKS